MKRTICIVAVALAWLPALATVAQQLPELPPPANESATAGPDTADEAGSEAACPQCYENSCQRALAYRAESWCRPGDCPPPCMPACKCSCSSCGCHGCRLVDYFCRFCCGCFTPAAYGGPRAAANCCDGCSRYCTCTDHNIRVPAQNDFVLPMSISTE